MTVLMRDHFDNELWVEIDGKSESFEAFINSHKGQYLNGWEVVVIGSRAYVFDAKKKNYVRRVFEWRE